MGDVVDINDHKPHMTGNAVCMECKNEWIALSLLGTTQLQCENCGSYKGIYTDPVRRYDHAHLTCKCGNDYLHLTTEGPYCPRCGNWLKYE